MGPPYSQSVSTPEAGVVKVSEAVEIGRLVVTVMGRGGGLCFCSVRETQVVVQFLISTPFKNIFTANQKGRPVGHSSVVGCVV